MIEIYVHPDRSGNGPAWWGFDSTGTGWGKLGVWMIRSGVAPDWDACHKKVEKGYILYYRGKGNLRKAMELLHSLHHKHGRLPTITEFDRVFSQTNDAPMKAPTPPAVSPKLEQPKRDAVAWQSLGEASYF